MNRVSKRTNDWIKSQQQNKNKSNASSTARMKNKTRKKKHSENFTGRLCFHVDVYYKYIIYLKKQSLMHRQTEALRAVNICTSTPSARGWPEWVWLCLLMNYDWCRVKCIAIAGKVYDTVHNVYTYGIAFYIYIHYTFCSIWSIPENMFAMPDTICVCVRACGACVCDIECIFSAWCGLYAAYSIEQGKKRAKKKKNSADPNTHSYCKRTHIQQRIFKWEMTNATETAQTAIKFIIYLNCQAFFVASFLCTK